MKETVVDQMPSKKKEVKKISFETFTSISVMTIFQQVKRKKEEIYKEATEVPC